MDMENLNACSLKFEDIEIDRKLQLVQKYVDLRKMIFRSKKHVTVSKFYQKLISIFR